MSDPLILDEDFSIGDGEYKHKRQKRTRKRECASVQEEESQTNEGYSEKRVPRWDSGWKKD